MNRAARSPGLDASWRVDDASCPCRADGPGSPARVPAAPLAACSARRAGPAARADRPNRPAPPPDGPGFRIRRRERRAAAHGGADRPGAAGDLPRHRPALSRDPGLPRPARATGLGLQDIRNAYPDASLLRRHDRHGRLFADDPDFCCEHPQDPAAGRGAGGLRAPGSPAASASRVACAGRWRRSSWKAGPGGSSSTRWRPGTRTGSRPTASPTTCRRIRCSPGATARSAAPPAPGRPPPTRRPAPDAGSASTRPSAASTSRCPTETTYEPRQPRAAPARRRAVRRQRARGPRHHPRTRLGRAAGLARGLPGRPRRTRRGRGASGRHPAGRSGGRAAADPLRDGVRQRRGGRGQAGHRGPAPRLQGDAQGRGGQQPGRGGESQEPAARRRHVGRGRASLARRRLLSCAHGGGCPAP